MNKEDYYVRKFGWKMLGSSWTDARAWVKGLETLTMKQRARVLKRIKKAHYPGVR